MHDHRASLIEFDTDCLNIHCAGTESLRSQQHWKIDLNTNPALTGPCNNIRREKALLCSGKESFPCCLVTLGSLQFLQ